MFPIAQSLHPVPCPRCGEAQNTMVSNTPRGFDPAVEPFGPVTCMACGRTFTRSEYMQGQQGAAPGQG